MFQSGASHRGIIMFRSWQKTVRMRCQDTIKLGKSSYDLPLCLWSDMVVPSEIPPAYQHFHRRQVQSSVLSAAFSFDVLSEGRNWKVFCISLTKPSHSSLNLAHSVLVDNCTWWKTCRHISASPGGWTLPVTGLKTPDKAFHSLDNSHDKRAVKGI